MRRLKISTALLLSLFALSFPCLRAAEPTQPGPSIESVVGAVEWGPLVASLAAKGSLYSTFTEQRWFGFKKTPVELKGELRYSPEYGLCLNYLGADAKMIILDSQGVVMRDAKGRQRLAPNDSKVSDLVRSVLYIMQLDLQQLRQVYDLYGARDGNDWRLDFEPRSKEQAKLLGNITVFGIGQDVRHLVFRRGPQSRIEIFIGQTRALQTFSAEERKRFFR